MQILTCGSGETVEVGPDIRITILAVDGDEVVFEVESPDDLSVTWPEPLAVGAV